MSSLRCFRPSSDCFVSSSSACVTVLKAEKNYTYLCCTVLNLDHHQSEIVLKQG